MTHNAISDAARRSRYSLTAGQTLPVAIQRLGEGEQPANGELIDVSASGARILSDVLLRFGEKLILHIETNPIGASISIECHVRWIRGENSEEKWIVGCAFECHLEERVLDEYVEEGILERRQSDRQNVSMRASVEFEGIRGDLAEVDLCDLGLGGFCFRSPNAGKIGSRLLMNVNNTSCGALEGRIMWQSTDDGKHLIGCQWENRKGIDFARQLAQPIEVESNRPKRKLRNPLIRSLVVAVVAFALGVLLTSARVALLAS